MNKIKYVLKQYKWDIIAALLLIAITVLFGIGVAINIKY